MDANHHQTWDRGGAEGRGREVRVAFRTSVRISCRHRTVRTVTDRALRHPPGDSHGDGSHLISCHPDRL